MSRILMQKGQMETDRRHAAMSGDDRHLGRWITALALVVSACDGESEAFSEDTESAEHSSSSSTGEADDKAETGEEVESVAWESGGEDVVNPSGIEAGLCECNQEILPGQASVDVSKLAPGTVLCLRASTAAERGPLELKGFAGTASKPIVVRNCDGAVRIKGGVSKPALRVPSGSYFRITGSGAAGVERGLVLSAPDAPAALLLLRVGNAEIDHIEVDASEFAAIMAKIDPSSTNCKVGDRRYDSYVMKGISIHDNYLHDVVGEGIYLGNSFYRGDSTNYCGKNASCDLTPCGGVQYPHEVRDVRIYKNVIEATGWDGIQVGSAVAGCLLEQNVVRNWGTEKKSSHDHGIQVGDGSSCTVRRNLLVNGGIGMQIAGIGGSVVHDNIIVGHTGYGVYVNPRPTPLATDVVEQGYVGGFVVAQNTLIAAADQQGAVLRDVNVAGNPLPSNNRLADNLVVSPASGYLQLTPTYGWTVQANLRFATTAEAGLLGAAAENFCPAAGSKPVSAGVNLAGLGLASDFHGGPRAVGPGWDVGAVECR